MVSVGNLKILFFWLTSSGFGKNRKISPVWPTKAESSCEMCELWSITSYSSSVTSDFLRRRRVWRDGQVWRRRRGSGEDGGVDCWFGYNCAQAMQYADGISIINRCVPLGRILMCLVKLNMFGYKSYGTFFECHGTKSEARVSKTKSGAASTCKISWQFLRPPPKKKRLKKLIPIRDFSL